MNELKKIIFAILNGKVATYYERATQTVNYPYAVYNLTNSEADFDKDDYILEVDVYDKTSNPDELDQLCDDLIKALDKVKQYKQSEIQTNIYRISRLVIPETEEVRRRQLRFICKTYKGEIV